jgi:hypothetical protein
VIRHWLRTLLLDARPYVTQADAIRLMKHATVDGPQQIVPAKVIYPEADRAKVGDADILGLVLQREKEAKQQANLKTIPFQARGVR